MRKIININFQGRVIPIEETAYDILKQYIESLRLFFADEEGRDEIINDIEGRIAELFSNTLVKGATCITDDDVHIVINSIGRPEDFDDQETKVKEQLKDEGARAQGSSKSGEPRGRLYRDGDDKILGGVCAGIASYFRIDPAIVRILFALVTLGGLGSGLLLYILMWIVLPVKRLDRAIISKRLYRNPEDKVIAGVASGVAAYFDVAVWIPRLVFALPLFITVVSSIWRNLFWDHFSMPTSIVFSSFGGTFFLVYAILWMVIPEASSASEKLEMKGEKVDLNSIKNTIQEDLGSFKQKAEKWGEEFKSKAQEWGDELGGTIKDTGSQFSREAGYAGKSAGRRAASGISIALRAFFLLIAGIIAFSLLLALLGLVLGGVSVMPLKNFFLNGFWQNFLAVATLVLFLCVPVVGLLTWFIRRMIGAHSRKRSYLGMLFGSLWTLGWICAIVLVALVVRDYRGKNGIDQDIPVQQPAGKKLLVRVAPVHEGNNYGSEFFGINRDDEGFPVFGLSEDSLLLRSVRIWIVKSADSNYHVQTVKFSHATTQFLAKEYAARINFEPVMQSDSVLTLPNGFVITSDQKFHNQQVLVIVAVPTGKRILIDESVNTYNWFSVNASYKRRRNWAVEWNHTWDNEGYSWRENVEYIMTADKGLKSVKLSDDDIEEGQRSRKEQLQELERKRKELREEQKKLRKALQEDSMELMKQQTKNDDNVQQEHPAAPKVTASDRLMPNPSGLLLLRYSI